ncbi:MAG: cytochrome c biogenesis protein CcsA [Verrucomicrobia bacterium]|nr:cytochrome c biogenesis protein CcsA [Verrucomicrobiota bacterium]
MAVGLYGVSAVYSVFLWRHGFRQDNRVNYLLLASALVFHTAAMILRGFSLNRCPVNNLYEATTFFAWTIVAAYLVVGVWSRLRFLGAFASPILFAVGVFALMPSLDVRGPKPQFTHGLASLHASVILLAYGAFGLAAIAALMFLTQERNLKFHKLRAVLSLLPPIQRLETVMSRLLVAGFILLTLGLVAGSMNLKQTKGVYYEPDAKIHWSVVVWLLYLSQVIMRWRFAQGGRRFALGVLGSFAFVLLTFWGFNLLSGIHHP